MSKHIIYDLQAVVMGNSLIRQGRVAGTVFVNKIVFKINPDMYRTVKLKILSLVSLKSQVNPK